MSSDKEKVWQSYYPNQLKNIYEDTKFFLRLLKDRHLLEDCRSVLDLGCGGGARTIQVAKEFPGKKFAGFDYVHSMIDLAKELNQFAGADVDFAWGDWMNLGAENKARFDLIFSFHTLCCFKDVEEAIKALIAVSPKKLVLKSLFYDGPMDVLIHQRHHTHEMKDNDPDGDFNIFSMQKVEKVFREAGWSSVEFVPFEIGIDLPRPDHKGAGSYTRNLDGQRRALFSGPVYLPWHFLIAKR